MFESAVDFQPLREASKVTKLEKESFISTADELESGMGVLASSLCCCEFTESLKSEFPSTGEEVVEDFRNLPPEHEEGECGCFCQNEDHQDSGVYSRCYSCVCVLVCALL